MYESSHADLSSYMYLGSVKYQARAKYHLVGDALWLPHMDSVRTSRWAEVVDENAFSHRHCFIVDAFCGGGPQPSTIYHPNLRFRGP